MTEELKHCPCCGEEAYLAEVDDGFRVYCLCGFRTDVFKTRGQAAAVWNKRSIENELIEKIKKLEAENTRLREALEEIKNNVKEAQDPVYSFHFGLDSKHGVFILETDENTLKEIKK